MPEPIAVGVVGVGYLGRFHALIHSRHPGVRLVGVADTNQETAQAVAAEAGCEAFTDPLALIGQVDAVSIVVPTSLHLEVSKPYLEAGVHVLLEKPIAATTAEAEELVRAADRAKVLFQIGHLERFNAGVMALAERIRAPRFIEAHRLSPFVPRATDVDVITDLMIHDIDIILSLMDADIRHISAVGTPVLTNHVDIANARIEFDDGSVANVIASRVSRERMRRIRVFTEQRYLSLDFIEQKLDLVRTQAQPGEEWPEIITEQLEIEPVKPLDAEIDAFVRSVREGRAPLVDGRVGLRALEVALEVHRKIPD